MKLTDPVVAPLVDAYRTCEFATMAKDGTPVAWPLSGLPRPDGTFLLTTSIAFPQKALNIRRDPRVALLFSDPTASGLKHPPHVLVRGTATCADNIRVDPTGDLYDFWLRIFERQPGSRGYPNPPARWLTDWYFMRLIIEVTPETVELVPPPDAAPGGDEPAGHSSAVLSLLDADGVPLLHRTGSVRRPDGYAVTVPPDASVVPGRAGLLVHRHNDKLAGIQQTLVRGDLIQDNGSWVLRPTSVTQPAGRGPRDTLATLRKCRATAARYLSRRGLSRPAVPWPDYRALAATAKTHD